MSNTEEKRMKEVNLQIPRGRTYRKQYNFFDSAGDPKIDATWTVLVQIRKSEKKSSGLIETFGVDLTDIVLGTIYITLTKTQADILEDIGHYDIKLTDTVGTLGDKTWIYGAITFYDVPGEDV